MRRAKTLSDYVAEHVKAKADPGSEASIRRQIEALQQQEFERSDFTPGLGVIARPWIPHVEDVIAAFDPLQSVQLRAVGAAP